MKQVSRYWESLKILKECRIMAVIETSENAKELVLQTHYYKASYEQIKKAYVDYLDTVSHVIVSENDDYHEIYSEVPHFTVIAKIIEQSPIETSIDFYINAEYLVGNNKKALNFINAVYKKLEEQYEFKGVALHK